ncbi:helicase, putative [Trichomonas vaginalis G3]|uniref:ATP-dependent DNA helicase n=1 Tax=Trichomonas vaginalis (strain ATCC PRA-98 / G3) TaxID=412133 RepID=A2EG76_TRIV3|nr:G-quadruplex DNA unwinding [Trichomonas vaginalis G3]EAY08352.1 helicase, putative [Trichomonas vaginalis G3]KAI5546265.1 G-quadruplex DNA unwinding [Trichomonas vaginalis G3]|eukprot:XP_001320575.1 helicase [Trichomonas vaginalis G3]
MQQLSQEQLEVKEKIIAFINNDDENSSNVMFFQGRAGTEKTYLLNQIISDLRKDGKKVLVTGTTGIAASKYPQGSTVHSLFKLKIKSDDLKEESGFYSNVGLNSFLAHILYTADLFIIDEASMLIENVANDVDTCLKYIVAGKKGTMDQMATMKPFGGKKVLLMGDLLQLPPVVPDYGESVLQRLITSCYWWKDCSFVSLKKQMRTKNEKWSSFLSEVAEGNIQNKKWTSLIEEFGITVTHDREEAIQFYLKDVDLTGKFPMDQQWVSSTNKLTKEMNEIFAKMHKDSLQEN